MVDAFLSEMQENFRRLKFWEVHGRPEGKCYIFTAYKDRNKKWVVYLERKLQEDGYGWCIFMYKCKKTVEKMYLETSKQQTKYRQW